MLTCFFVCWFVFKISSVWKKERKEKKMLHPLFEMMGLDKDKTRKLELCLDLQFWKAVAQALSQALFSILEQKLSNLLSH